MVPLDVKGNIGNFAGMISDIVGFSISDFTIAYQFAVVNASGLAFIIFTTLSSPIEF